MAQILDHTAIMRDKVIHLKSITKSNWGSGWFTSARKYMFEMLNLLERGYPEGSGPDSILESTFKPVELLDFAAFCYAEPWADGASQPQAEAFWKKHFRIWAAKAPEEAFQKALDQRTKLGFIKPFLETFILETAELDIQLAHEYVQIFASKTVGEGNETVKKLQKLVNARVGQSPQRDNPLTGDAAAQVKILEDYYATRQTTEIDTPDKLAERLQMIFAAGRAMNRESGHDYLAAGLWADIFDRYVVADRDKALALAFKMLPEAASGSAMARQVSASLLAARDRQRTPFLRPRQAGGMNVPAFKTGLG